MLSQGLENLSNEDLKAKASEMMKQFNNQVLPSNFQIFAPLLLLSMLILRPHFEVRNSSLELQVYSARPLNLFKKAKESFILRTRISEANLSLPSNVFKKEHERCVVIFHSVSNCSSVLKTLQNMKN